MRTVSETMPVLTDTDCRIFRKRDLLNAEEIPYGAAPRWSEEYVTDLQMPDGLGASLERAHENADFGNQAP